MSWGSVSSKETNKGTKFKRKSVKIKKTKGSTEITRKRNGCYYCDSHGEYVVALKLKYSCITEQVCEEHIDVMIQEIRKRNDEDYENEGELKVKSFKEPNKEKIENWIKKHTKKE